MKTRFIPRFDRRFILLGVFLGCVFVVGAHVRMLVQASQSQSDCVASRSGDFLAGSPGQSVSDVDDNRVKSFRAAKYAC